MTDRLLAGPVPYALGEPGSTAEQVEALLEVGITAVVSMLGDDELKFLPNLAELYAPWLRQGKPRLRVHHGFVVRDGATPSPEKMQRILNALDGALAAEERVYVHCIGGRGRTGTVVGCWLARHGVATGEGVLQYLAALRREQGLTKESPETRGQRRRVSTWQVGQ